MFVWPATIFKSHLPHLLLHLEGKRHFFFTIHKKLDSIFDKTLLLNEKSINKMNYGLRRKKEEKQAWLKDLKKFSRLAGRYKEDKNPNR
jgi:hypothetical protein